jgi:hypothetical protein
VAATTTHASGVKHEDHSTRASAPLGGGLSTLPLVF